KHLVAERVFKRNADCNPNSQGSPDSAANNHGRGCASWDRGKRFYSGQKLLKWGRRSSRLIQSHSRQSLHPRGRITGLHVARDYTREFVVSAVEARHHRFIERVRALTIRLGKQANDAFATSHRFRHLIIEALPWPKIALIETNFDGIF